MRTTTLGSDGPRVGVIGLGCMGMTASYDMQTPRDEATSIAVIHQALDLGMTLRANLAIAGRVREMATRAGTTPARVALAWVLAQGQHVVPSRVPRPRGTWRTTQAPRTWS